MLVAILALAVACNPDKPAEDVHSPELVLPPARDPELLDTLTGTDKDSVAAEVPAAEAPPAVPAESQAPPAQQQPRPKPQPRPQPQLEKTEDPAPATAAFREGTYRLVQVQGESPPIVLDMTTECDSRLLSGEMNIKGGQFYFQSVTAEECNGKISNQEKHEASGDYRLEGNQLYLSIRYGDALGDARGVVEGNTIRLQHIGNNEEQQEVDWLFRLD